MIVLSVACIMQVTRVAFAQAVTADSGNQASLDQRAALVRYVDSAGGMSADEAVAYAFAHNGELLAVRQEIEAARALVRQAALRPNPTLQASGTRQVNGQDNSMMVEGMLPLELGGRRAARILVAQRELEVREQMVADRERMLAAEVRAKFGEALAEVLKLGFTDELLGASRRGYKLVVARVVEGRTPPLEQNMVLVEVNRLRSMRESSEGNVEVALLELRNLIGMKPEESLRLRGQFEDLVDQWPPQAEAVERALRERPDLRSARAAERLAEAQIAAARATGRLDVSLSAGYQRMSSGFPVSGINEAGQLQPVEAKFHFFTFGLSLDLPVRNKNQGAIEAALAGRRRRQGAVSAEAKAEEPAERSPRARREAHDWWRARVS